MGMNPAGNDPQNLLHTDLVEVLEATGGTWEALRGRRVLITGGTGFVGCWLLETLLFANRELGLGTQALVLTRDPRRFMKKAPHLAGDPAVTLVEGDVLRFPVMPGPVDYLVHAAAEVHTHPPKDRLLPVFEGIVHGTQQALEFARQQGAQKALLVSSGAVYGAFPPGLQAADEDYRGAPDPADPGSVYGESKRAAEMLASIYAGQFGLEATVARCFSFMGPYLPTGGFYAVGNFLRDALRGGPIAVHGDGTAVRSYLYAAEMAAWLWTILLHGKPLRVYNVGSEEAIGIAGLARRIASEFTPEPEIRIDRAEGSGQPASVYVPSTRRARAELNLRQTVGLQEAIRRNIRWLAARPEFIEGSTRIS